MAGTEIQGRASLIGFEIPTGGEAFFFKTVGGKIEINARHVDESLAETGTRFGWLAGSLIGLLVLVQFGGPLARHRVAGKLLAGLLFLYSVILMVSSLVPDLGLFLMLVSIAWVFWLYFGQDRQPVTTDVAD
jgi:fructose-specific phosphotransferase system IIC component